MKNQKKDIWAVIMLLLLPLTFSITLDDLLNSYDFSFNAPQVNVSDTKVFGNDSDQEAEFLTINATLNVTAMGDYRIFKRHLTHSKLPHDEEIKEIIRKEVT